MQYRVKDGKQHRVHKEYVDVVVRMRADGDIEPVIVCWRDGRSFHIDEILGEPSYRPEIRGRNVREYRVRFGGHETELFLERACTNPHAPAEETLRWWVWATDVTRHRSCT